MLAHWMTLFVPLVHCERPVLQQGTHSIRREPTSDRPCDFLLTVLEVNLA